MYEILISLLIVCVIIVIIAGVIVIKRQHNKIIYYEEYILDVQKAVNQSYLNMKSVDILGSFEADDEIGESFRLIKDLLTKLNEIVQ